MNLFFHSLLGFVVVETVFGNAADYAVVIFISSVLLDLDHIPYLLRVRGKVIEKRWGSSSRTRFHELYGLVIVSFIVSVLSFFDFNLSMIAGLCFILHYSVDFLVGKTRPLFPYSKSEICLGITPQGYWNKIFFEVFLTLIFGVIAWRMVIG